MQPTSSSTNAGVVTGSAYGHVDARAPLFDSLHDIFFSMPEEQEKHLADAPSFAIHVQLLQERDFSQYSSALKVYLYNNIRLVNDLENSTKNTPNALKFYLHVVQHVTTQGVWPWSLIGGASFLSHLRNFSQSMPPEMGLGAYLDFLGEESLAIFEDIVVSQAKIRSRANGLATLAELMRLRDKASILLQKNFPGTQRYIETLDQDIASMKGSVGEARNIYQKITSTDTSKEEKINLLKRTYGSTKDALRGILIEENNFNTIVLYLQIISQRRIWQRVLFDWVCLEKAQNITYNLHAVKGDDTSAWLAAAWAHYYESPSALFRSSQLFNPEQQAVLETLIQDKVIKLLFLYTLTNVEESHEIRYKNEMEGAIPTVPLSLDLVKKGITVPFPLNILDHAMGGIAEPTAGEAVTMNMYNTGLGLKKHPATADTLKVQTHMGKDAIPLPHLFDETHWRAIRAMDTAADPVPLYDHMLNGVAKDGEMIVSSHSLDFEAFQHSGSCIVQHMQAMIRHQFMQCEALGTKEERYMAYKVVMRDFMLYLGKLRFPHENRESVRNGTDAKEQEVLATWEMKEPKVQGVLDLAKRVPPEAVEKGNSLSYLYGALAWAKGQKGTPQSESTTSLREIYAKYHKNLHENNLETVRKMPLKEFIHTAAFDIVFARTKEDRKAFVLLAEERLKGMPEQMAALHKRLERYNINDAIPGVERLYF